MTSSIQDSTAALELQPGHLKARYRRGMAYKEIGQYEASMIDMEKCIEQGGDGKS